MKFCACFETVLFSTGLLLVTIHIAVSIRNSVRNASCSKLFKDYSQKACSIFKHFKERALQKKADKHVQEKLKLARLAAAKASYKANAHCLCFGVVLVLWNLARDSPRWMTAGQDVAAILVFAVLEFARLRPDPAELLLEVYFGLLMLLIAAFFWFTSLEETLISCFTCLTMRCAISVQHRKLSGVFFWNVVSTCSSFAFFQQSAQHGALASRMMLFEAFIVAALFFFVFALQNWTVALIQQELQAGLLKAENSASLSLLDMFCDVVLRLRMDLTLEEDSRQFAALLMRSSGASMQGSSFTDFITEEDDRRVFAENVSALRASSDELVGSFCSTLSDSLHNLVNVEMVFAQVSSLDDEDSSYVLGIREGGDVAHVMPAFGSKQPKRPVAMAHKGTPSSLERRHFENKKAPASSQTAHARIEHLQFPGMIPTSDPAMCIQMLKSMSRWNVKVPPTTCCSFHAYVEKLRQIIRECSKMKCEASFPANIMEPRQRQCQECGLLDPCVMDGEYFECGFCKSSDSKPLATNASSIVEVSPQSVSL